MTVFKRQILIICRDDETAAKISKTPRNYADVWSTPIFSSMTGMRFDLIIVPTIESESAAEQAVIDDIIENVLPTHLRPDGRIVRI